MSERVQRALRELASALEEEAADNGRAPRGPPSRGRGTSPSASSTASYSSWSRVGGPCERAAATRVDPLGADPPSTSQQQLPLPLGRVPASAVVRGAPVNLYVILENPLQPHRVGWIRTSWIQLERSLPSGQLSTSRVRLRRVATVEDAVQLWKKVHPNLPCPELKQ